MRLVKAEIKGFGRLAQGTINLDNKVIAVVGPNEAGKTTLLNALAYIDNQKALAPTERSRGMAISDNEVVVRVKYLLDDDDRTSVAEFDLEEPPTAVWFSRTPAGGQRPMRTVEPWPRKAIAPLKEALASLGTAASTKALAELAFTPPEDAEDDTVPEDEARTTLQVRAGESITALFTDVEANDARVAVEQRADELRGIANELAAFALAPDLAEALDGVLAWHDTPDPADPVGKALWEVSPDIILFDDADRTLGSTHVLSDELVKEPPRSLRNLLDMAELDLNKLWATFSSGDEGERETLIGDANKLLSKKFAKAWKQSKVSVVLKTEQAILSIRIEQDGRRITQFDERSAGLKMFIALVAFLAKQDRAQPPILLIDEAETHLHIDAQADLVNTFMTQTQAAKVIYTTHSPACLPPDLGSNIRAVVPDPDPTHPYRSLIKGSFWDGAAGFSPLMLAMGAGAAAFSAARFVVLAEGASEMLVLPSLIKRAVNVADLEYQIAPGLSEVPPEMYPELDLAGARVAYLVDGDEGGQRRRKELIAGDVPVDRIVTLGALTLENLIDPTSYLRAVGLLLGECNPGVEIPALPTLPAVDAVVWPPFLSKWANQRGLKMPGKRAVASRIVEEQLTLPSDFGMPVLKQLHKELTAVLKRSISGGGAR
jgi:ABC-type cobalamin/Fe3+-siderophores transport system ATPase subunit